MITIQIGVVESIGIVIGGRSIRLYQLFAPLLLLPIIFSNESYIFESKSATFLISNLILLSILLLHPLVGFLDFFNHGMTMYMGATVAYFVFRDKIDISYIFFGLFVGAILLSIYNIANIEYVLQQNPGILHIPKLVGPGLGSGANGTVLTTGVLSGLFLVRYYNGRLQKGLIYISILLFSSLIILSQSRSSIIALVVGSAFPSIYLLQKKYGYDIVRGALLLLTFFFVLAAQYLASINPN